MHFTDKWITCKEGYQRTDG